MVTQSDGGCELVKCAIQGEVHGKRRRGTRRIAVDRENWCEVLQGWLIVTPDWTAKEEDLS